MASLSWRFAPFSTIAVGVVIACLTLPPLVSHWVPSFGAHDISRLAQWPTFLVCAACIIADGWRKPQWPVNRSALLLILTIALLGAMAVINAADKAHALREVAVLLGLVGAAICTAALPFSKAGMAVLLGASAGAGIYAAIVFLIAAITCASGSKLVASELFFGYDSYRFYNHAQTVSVPLLAIVACSKGLRRSARALAGIGLVLTLALLGLSAGRATSVALFAAGVLSLLIFRTRAYRWVGCVLFACCLGGVAYFLLVVLRWSTGELAQVTNSITSADLTSDHARFYLWRLALDDIAGSPWLGIGPMHFAHQLNPKAAHPHNVYLQIAAEWGIPLLLVLLVLAMRSLWCLARRIQATRDEAAQTVGVGLFAACIAVAFDGAFSGNFVMPVSQMWIALLIGVSIAWYRTQSPHELRSSDFPIRAPYRAVGVVFASILMASQLWLLYSVYPEVKGLSEHLEYVRNDLAPNARTNPRFWSHGWF